MEFNPDHFFNTLMPEAYDAVYTPAVGDPVETIVFLDRGIDRFPDNFESTVNDQDDEIEFSIAYVPNPKRGETFTVTLPAGDVVYTLQDEISNDGFSIRMSVK